MCSLMYGVWDITKVCTYSVSWAPAMKRRHAIMQSQVRVFELGQLAMKFERHLDAEVVDFQILSDDYSKAAFLCADRSICLHAKYGAHYRTRIPHAGRDIAYIPAAAGPYGNLSHSYTALWECVHISCCLRFRLLSAFAHIDTCTGLFNATLGCLHCGMCAIQLISFRSNRFTFSVLFPWTEP